MPTLMKEKHSHIDSATLENFSKRKESCYLVSSRPSASAEARGIPSDTGMFLVVLLFANIHFSSTVEVPADVRCCKESSWLSQVGAGACVDIDGVVVSQMTISCAGNFTLTSDDVKYKIIIRDDDTVVLIVDPLETTMNKGKFCLGNTSAASNVSWQQAVLCPDPDEEVLRTGVDTRTGGILTLVSIPFLLLTLIVYALLPELRDLQGKSIMCLCASFAVALGFLAYEDLHGYPDMESCTAGGFLRYYVVLATFFWMNAITIQVFLSVRFGGVGAVAAMMMSKRGLVYCSVYAWGTPAVLLAIVLHNNYNMGAGGVPAHLVPGIGIGNCWFFSPLVQWLYFYGPLTLTVAANCILFLWTSIILWRQKFLSKQRKVLTYKLAVSLRLFVVMGVSWLLEPLSFAHAQYHLFWVIADAWNLLQGVLIFIVVVVLRKRAMSGLVGRGYALCLTKPLRRCLSTEEDNEGTVAYDTRAAASECVVLQTTA